MKRFIKVCLTFCSIIFVLVFISQITNGEEEMKKVLFISSYHAGFDTVPDQIEGIRSVFDGTNIQLDIDFMDTKRQNTQENYTNYYNFLKYRIDHDEAYDVVLVGDDNGLQFLLDNRENLFTDIPIVFFGINDEARANLAGSMPLTTGIVEGISVNDNLSMALKLFPKTESIIGIVDNTRTGQGDAQMFMDASKSYTNVKFALLNSSEYTFDEFQTKINEVNGNALIFYLSMFEDKLGKVITISEAVSILDTYAQVPIFRMSVGGVGTGVFGGNMVSYIEQGRLAAEMAKSIIEGENPDLINVIQKSPNKNYFDYYKLKQYNISMKEIPQGSIIINQPTNYYKKYEAVIIPAAFVLFMLSIVLVVLAVDNKKLKAKDILLSDNNMELAALYEEVTASEEELKNQFDILLSSQKALNESEERYKKLAFTDTLTQLNNRSALLKFLDEYVIDESKEWYLLYIDLDNFKYINDSRGHEVGDEILRIIGNRLNELKDDFTYLSRLGGDEFVILVDHVNDKHFIELFAENVMDVIKSSIEIQGMVFYLTCSIGISVHPKDGYEKNILLRKADMAMYQAKYSGRSRCIFFTQQMEMAFADKMMIQNRIRFAIDNNEFELYYQPQFDMHSKLMCGSEVLLRWQDSNNQFISPAIFIPIAEEQGIIGLIGNWVFNEAAKQAAKWQESADGLVKISVNVSAAEIIQAGFSERFVAIVKDNGFKCEQISVEITEGILIKAKEKAVAELNNLRANGVEIHLDDFGSGFSSLNYLIDLPLDVIKIDRAFIKNITTKESNKDMAKFIIDISHRFNLKVIAEGVETKEQFDLLEAMNCDMIQGYYYGKPMNVLDIEAFYYATLE